MNYILFAIGGPELVVIVIAVAVIAGIVWLICGRGRR